MNSSMPEKSARALAWFGHGLADTIGAMRQVVLYNDAEDGGWVAEVPSLPGCVSQGETKAKALTNVRAAIRAWIAAAEQLHRRIPPETRLVELHEV